jgi:hypothetical protein
LLTDDRRFDILQRVAAAAKTACHSINQIGARIIGLLGGTATWPMWANVQKGKRIRSVGIGHNQRTAELADLMVRDELLARADEIPWPREGGMLVSTINAVNGQFPQCSKAPIAFSRPMSAAYRATKRLPTY